MSYPLKPSERKPLCARCRKKPVDAGYRPFCSKRCADADLGHWMTGSYVIPGQAAQDAEENTAASPEAEEPGQD